MDNLPFLCKRVRDDFCKITETQDAVCMTFNFLPGAFRHQIYQPGFTAVGHLIMVGCKPLFKQVLIFTRFIGGVTQFFNILYKELSTRGMYLSDPLVINGILLVIN